MSPEFTGRLRTPRLAASPGSPVVGEMYYDTVTNLLYFWNGTAWIPANAAAASISSAKAHSTSTFAWSAADQNWRGYTPTLTTDWDFMGTSWSANAGQFTAVTAGRYLITVTVYNISAAGNMGVGCMVNATTGFNLNSYTVPVAAAGEKGGCQSTAILNLAAGDTVRLFGFHSAGGSASLAIEAIKLDSPGSQPPSTLTSAQLTALTPVDGQEVYLRVDDTAGVKWHLRYNAGSASAYKWECLGGPPVVGKSTGNESSTVSGGLHTPALTAPRAGEYLLSYTNYVAGTPNANTAVTWGCVLWDGTTEFGADFQVQSQFLSGSSAVGWAQALNLQNGLKALTASQIVRLRPKVVNWDYLSTLRIVTMAPVRVS